MPAPSVDILLLTMATLETDARLLNIAAALRRAGYSVVVVGSGTPSADATHTAPEFPCHYIKLPSARWAVQYWHFRRAALEVLASYCPRQVYAAEVSSLSVAATWKKKHNIRLVYDAREFFFALGALHRRPLAQFVIAQMEERGLRRADRVICTGEDDAAIISEKYRLQPPTVILNLPPYRPPVESNVLRERLEIGESSPLLLYQGMLFEGRGLLPAVEALLHLPTFHFCLVGAGDFGDTVQARAEVLGIGQRVHCLGSVPYRDLHPITCSADVGISFIEPISLSYSMALPNKLFEYCMAGLPTLASDLPAQGKYIRRWEIGKALSTDASAVELAAAIAELFEQKAHYRIRCLAAAENLCFESQQETVEGIFSM